MSVPASMYSTIFPVSVPVYLLRATLSSSCGGLGACRAPCKYTVIKEKLVCSEDDDEEPTDSPDVVEEPEDEIMMGSLLLD